MKLRVLNILASLFVAACVITSCLDDDSVEVEYSSDASITAFSIVDSIITYYSATTAEGNDTTLSTAVIGSDYPFVIDQHSGQIYNADSLPVGTDVSKVVVSITSDYYTFIVAETDSVWEEGDSLDFTSPIQLKVMSQMGTYGKTYTAQINVHQQDPDSLAWTQLAGNFSTDIQAQKAVYANNTLYVFAEQDDQVAMTCASTDDGRTWTALQAIDIPVKADYTSVMAWGEQLYILADNTLYTSTNGINWTKVETSQAIAKLLANVYTENEKRMIGVDEEGRYIESADGIEWMTYDALPSDFPTSNYSFAAYKLATNSALNRIVLLGASEAESSDTTTVAWTQLTGEQGWSDLLTDKTAYACPRLENACMIHYNNQLYTFGGQGGKETVIEPFSAIYASEDNGITWKAFTSKVMFPETFGDLYEQADGHYSCVVDDEHHIWVMWSQTGEVWRGRINKLGFKKQ